MKKPFKDKVKYYDKELKQESFLRATQILGCILFPILIVILATCLFSKLVNNQRYDLPYIEQQSTNDNFLNKHLTML